MKTKYFLSDFTFKEGNPEGIRYGAQVHVVTSSVVLEDGRTLETTVNAGYLDQADQKLIETLLANKVEKVEWRPNFTPQVLRVEHKSVPNANIRIWCTPQRAIWHKVKAKLGGLEAMQQLISRHKVIDESEITAEIARQLADSMSTETPENTTENVTIGQP